MAFNYTPAKLTPDAARKARERMGRHADQYTGLIGWDGHEVITHNGSRATFKESDIVKSTIVEPKTNKNGAVCVRVQFADGTWIETYRPYWLPRL